MSFDFRRFALDFAVGAAVLACLPLILVALLGECFRELP